MSDPKGQGDQNTTPDDIASLYSWANLHGAKYRDFSASRAQVRESSRLRVQEATEAERQQLGAPVQATTPEARRADQPESAAEARPEAEWETQQGAQWSAIVALQRALQTAEQRETQEPAQRAVEPVGHQAAQEAEQLALQAAEERAMKEAAQRAAEEAERQAAQRAARLAEQAAFKAAERAAEERAARLAADLAALQAAQRAADQTTQPAAQHTAQHPDQHPDQQPAWQQPLVERFASTPVSSIPVSIPAPQTPPADPSPPRPPFQGYDYPGYERMPPGYVPPMQPFFGVPGEPSVTVPVAPLSQPPIAAPVLPQQEVVRGESVVQQRNPWPPADSRESAARPAWLMPVRAETPNPTPQPPASQPLISPETLQGSRDRLASRWFALRGVFETGHAPVESAPAPVAAHAPVMAVFSLAGGVGKTSIVATLGRALSARGERVLLVDTAAYGLLPFFFGARDQRPGLLRTFSPPGIGSDAPIQLVTIDPESLGPEPAGLDPSGSNGLGGEISRYARGGISRVIVDLATASGATTRRVMRMAPMILVPVIPDMNSVVSVSSIDDFFQHNSATGGKVQVYYVMNQFDPSLPLHLDIREVLREQLGDRLLPFALRRTPAVSEALAEGMTVMDYAPSSTVAEDFGTLAGWVKSLSAPASTTYRGVRWSER
jgi:cellulose biosynthesis protein BcsQ